MIDLMVSGDWVEEYIKAVEEVLPAFDVQSRTLKFDRIV
jgi:hypothetical protein